VLAETGTNIQAESVIERVPPIWPAPNARFEDGSYPVASARWTCDIMVQFRNKTVRLTIEGPENPRTSLLEGRFLPSSLVSAGTRG